MTEVEKISKVIDALKDYAVKNARVHHPKDAYNAPYLASWDALMWFELVQDRELVAFLISGTDRIVWTD